ncbi:hypothetical protein EMIHUDRAFT_125026, partial [Emiliania huxleyi CCMP1516]
SDGAVDDLRSAYTARPDVEEAAFDALYGQLLEARGDLEALLGRPLSRGVEATFVVYEPGCFYRRHVDSLAGVDPAGSGGRAYSFVVYLTGEQPWQPSDGGALRVFCDALGEEVEEEVLPAAGLLVLFDSKRVSHEVMPTRRQRTCLVGWFREEV